jgi:hypothetical protein
MRLTDETAGEEALRGTLRGFGCEVDKRIVDVRVDSIGSGAMDGLEGTFSGSRTLSPARNLGVGMVGSRERV